MLVKWLQLNVLWQHSMDNRASKLCHMMKHWDAVEYSMVAQCEYLWQQTPPPHDLLINIDKRPLDNTERSLDEDTAF
jgi:hypothetical protein